MATIDLTGQRFGHWLVLHRSSAQRYGTWWHCHCDCGTEKPVKGPSLRDGRSQSCGCAIGRPHGRSVSLIGTSIGRWVVLREAEGRQGGQICYLCRCSCGTERVVAGYSLRAGLSPSCGCISVERNAVLNRTHGMSQTATHATWSGMLARCLNPRVASFQHYGGRGVRVCERWRRFENFLADMGERPSAAHSLDRVDPEGDYCPDNCRWATVIEQANNRRYHHRITYQGQTRTLAEWCRHLGLSIPTVMSRIERGADIEGAFRPITLRFKMRLYTYHDRTLSLQDWSARIGIPKGTLQSRLNKGWSLERVLSTPHK